MSDFTAKGTEFSRDLELDRNTADLPFLLKTMDFLFEECRETERAIAELGALSKAGTETGRDDALEELVDGFGDVAFIALNGIYKSFVMLGKSHEEATELVSTVMNRICDANLGKKQPDGSVKYNNGKVVKPEGWKAPTYTDVLAA